MSIYSSPAPITSQGASGTVGSSTMGPLIPLAIQGGLSLFGSLFGASKQASAAHKAAQLQSKDHAASLAFMRQQAQNAWAEAEATRRANYDQWAADRRLDYGRFASRERRLGAVARQRGWGDREIPALEIPAYVATQDPEFVPRPRQTRFMMRPVGEYLVPTEYGPGTVGSFLR